MRPAHYSQPRSTSIAASSEAIHVSAAVRQNLCCTEALERLGPVLCMYLCSDRHPLRGWERARHVVHYASIECGHGPLEVVSFLDEWQQVCWRLALLPDTDYLQWDRFVEPLLHTASEPCLSPLPLWSRCGIAHAIGKQMWQSCPLRLHAIRSDSMSQRLAASCAALSPLGRQACAMWRVAEHA